jgi:hypothetical protein
MKRPILQSLVCTLGLVFALGVGLSAAFVGSAAAATSGYTPPTTPPPTTPPPTPNCPVGTTISSGNIGAGGGTVTGSVDGSNVTVTVPAGTFPSGVQVAITDVSQIVVTPAGTVIVLSFGVDFCVNGQKVTGTFSPPVTVVVSNPAIKAGDVLYEFVGDTLTPYAANVSNGQFTITVDSDPSFVLVASSSPTAAIPGATSVVTGKPFLLEGIIAGVLVFAGGVLLLFLRLRLRHR